MRPDFVTVGPGGEDEGGAAATDAQERPEEGGEGANGTAEETAEEPGESGRTTAGFRRSTVTVTCFPRFRMTKVFRPWPRDTTGNGPSYGGTKGRLTASTRRKTWEADSKAGSRREGRSP